MNRLSQFPIKVLVSFCVEILDRVKILVRYIYDSPSVLLGYCV